MVRACEKSGIRLEEHFHITYSKAKINEMTLLIISRATTIDYKKYQCRKPGGFYRKGLSGSGKRADS